MRIQGGGGGGSDILSLLGPLSGSLSGVSLNHIFCISMKYLVEFVKTILLTNPHSKLVGWWWRGWI